MPSSVMLRSVALVRTSFPEERIAYINRENRISELRTTLAVTSNRSTLQLASYCLMTEAIRFSETSVLTRSTLHHIPDDVIVHI
jgi:hypothetical protein